MSNRGIMITDEQRVALDSAVLQAIKSGAAKASEIVGVAEVKSAISNLPDAKSPLRWVDGSLQRLRGAGAIRYNGAKWSVRERGKTSTTP